MDDAEFDKFYAASGHALVGQVFALIGDLAEAQDVVQEAFVRAWGRRASLDAGGNPEAWVRTTARRLASSRWRRRQFRSGVFAAQPPPEPVAPLGDDTLHLVEALRTLPRDQREALVLHHLVDLPVPQVAAELGVAVGTVRSRMARGRAALADRLGPPSSQNSSSRPADPAPEAPRAH